METLKNFWKNTKKVLGDVIFYLQTPVIIVGSTLLVKYFSYSQAETSTALNLVSVISTIVVATGFCLLLFGIERDSSSRGRWYYDLRNFSSVVFGGLCLIGLSLHHHAENNFGIIPIMLACAFGLTAVIIIIRSAKGNSVNEGLGQSLFFIIFLSSSAVIYIQFGSQFIWLPIIAITFALITLDVNRNSGDYAYEFSEIIYLFPVGIGIISTLSQFWFTTCILGMPLWKNLLYLLLIVILIAVIVFFILFTKHLRKIKEERIIEEAKKEKEKEKKDAEIKKEEEKKEMIQKLIDSINSKDINAATWKEIITLINTNTYGMNYADVKKYVPIFGVMSKLKLSDLVTISEIKKHIIWNPELETVLSVIGNILEKNYDDRVLQDFMTQLRTLKIEVREKSEYSAYEGLITLIEVNVPEKLRPFLDSDSE
ncbi:MAG: hypothetical protein MUF50_00590 [Planctomycetes bacterium]|nr:hypothetical protein [Planctomycetota bacterium]